MLMMPIAAEMWTSERPGTPGHHAAKDQEGKLAHAGYKRNYHDYNDDNTLMIKFDYNNNDYLDNEDDYDCHAAKDQEGKLAHAGYIGDYHDSQWLSWS